MSGKQTINNNDSGLSVRTALNNMFIELYGRTVSVKDYGATGDGSTDDSASFQNAINACQGNGLSLYVPDGKYKLNGLIISSSLTMFGNGNSSELYTVSNAAMITVTSNIVKFANLRITGNDIGSAQKGIEFDTVQDFNISNLSFYTIGGAAIYASGTVITDSFTGTIDNCLFYKCGTGVHVLSRYEYVNILNCSVISSSYAGYRLNAGNFNINGGQITGCTLALYLESGVNDSHSSITGVLINHNSAINIQDIAKGLVFSGCQFHANIYWLFNSSKSVLFSGCEIGSNDFRFDGSEVHFSNCLDVGTNTFQNDYNGNTSYTLWDGTIIINSGDLKYLITSATENGSTAWELQNKSGVAKYKILDNGAVIQDELTGSLTDGAPTDAEIDAIIGNTPAGVGAGYKVSILDSNGSGLIYLIESDGTNWQYVAMTKAI